MKTLIPFLLFANILFSQEDKLLHASAGYVSSSITTGILQHYKVRHAFVIGIGVGTCLGIGKELYDKYTGRGVSDPMDAVYTIGGAALGSVTIQFSLNRKKQTPVNPTLDEPLPVVVSKD